MHALPWRRDIGQIDYTNRLLGIIPRIAFADRYEYAHSETKEYDQARCTGPALR